MDQHNNPALIGKALNGLSELYGIFNMKQITPDARDDNGKTFREHLEELKAAIDRFLGQAPER